MGQPFWDQAAPRPHFSQTLPEALRIKNQGVQLHQAAVYEDFGMSREATETTISSPTPDTKRKVASRPESTVSFARDQVTLYDAANGQEGANGAYMSSQDAMERFSVSPGRGPVFCKLTRNADYLQGARCGCVTAALPNPGSAPGRSRNSSPRSADHDPRGRIC
jgi:hypothetical protein